MSVLLDTEQGGKMTNTYSNHDTSNRITHIKLCMQPSVPELKTIAHLNLICIDKDVSLAATHNHITIR